MSSVTFGKGPPSADRDVELVERVRALETKLESELKHFATKAWVLGGVVSGMLSAAGIAVAIAVAVIKL